MGGVSGVNSLHYILLCGVAALRLAEAPGRSGLVASSRYKEFVFTAYFVMPDIRNCCAVFVSLRPHPMRTRGSEEWMM